MTTLPSFAHPRRRSLLGAAIGAALACTPAMAEAPDSPLRVWRDPGCACCALWIAHMRDNGFTVQESVVPDLAPIRRMLGVPEDLLGCHPALVRGLVVEGHVPALAVRQALEERPAGVRGLAVPGMPMGSPGMEPPPGMRAMPLRPYAVIAFGEGPHRPYMRFKSAERIG